MKPIDLVELVNKNANSVRLETYFEPDKGFYIYTGVFELQIGSNFVSTYFWTNVYPSVEEQFLLTTTHSSLPTSPGRYFGFGSVMKKSDINSFLSYLKNSSYNDQNFRDILYSRRLVNLLVVLQLKPKKWT